MGRRTKQQIQEDRAKLLKSKIRALGNLNAHLNEASGLSEEDMDKVKEFIILFIQCETVYKTLYSEMKKLKDDEKIDIRKLKFNVQLFEAALRYFGVVYDHEKMNKMFAASKSYLTCRDRIVHGLNMDSVNEVVANYDEMRTKMNELLTNVAGGQPV